ncbi:MAG: adenosylcobinamide-phosphate synthase CbiB [Hyphomicrobiales bacterium]
MPEFFLSTLNTWITLAATLIERNYGYPDRLYKLVQHPVVWMGALIDVLDDRLNNLTRSRGVFALAVVIAATAVITIPLTLIFRSFEYGWLLEALVACTILAQKSLGEQVLAVADGLEKSLEDGRKAVSNIVGRDPANLDETGVAKGAVESLAENTSDGIVAPVFWLLIGGLPGIAIYKAVNTCDSMIGHKSERHLHFGWASARLDDVLNFIPARLTGLLFCAVSGPAAGEAFTAMRRDAGNHVSPNAGWPEAAMAGGLGIRLGGPRSYQGRTVRLAWMGDGRQELGAEDIYGGLQLYERALNAMTAVLGVAAFISLFL